MDIRKWLGVRKYWEEERRILEVGPEMRYKLNINLPVKVKLTRWGEDYLAKRGIDFQVPDEEGYSTLPLKDVMEVFGRFLISGQTVMAFEDEIVIEGRDLKHI